MRDYGKISTSIWNSRKFGKIEDDARLLYLYLHTCPHVNSVGCFVLKDGYATADLNWPVGRYLKALDTLCKAYLVAFDRLENLVRVVNFLKFDPFTNPKHAQGAVKLATSLPDCREKLNVLNDISGCRHADESEILHREIDRLSKGYRNPEPEPEPEPELPSVTGAPAEQKINKPGPKKTDRAQIFDILGKYASPEAATSFIAYRNKIKKPITVTAAQRIQKQLELVLNGEGDPSDALGMCEERGWQGLKAEWYFNSKSQEQGQEYGQSKNNGKQSGYSGGAQGRPNGASGAHAGLIAGLADNADRYSRGEGSDDSDDAIPL